MISSKSHSGLIAVLRNYHFWIIFAIFVLLTVSHYSTFWGGEDIYPIIGLTRHTIDRILLIIPLVYTAIIFGVRGGIFALIVSAAIMLPYAFMAGDDWAESIVETCGVVLVGLLVNGWFRSLQNERRKRLLTIEQLEKTKQESELSEKRLQALHNISHSLSQIIDINQALDKALDQILQVMSLDIALVFVLNKDKNMLDLKSYKGVSTEFVEGVKTIGAGEGLNGLVAKTGEPLIVEDAANDPRLTREVVAKEKIAAQLIVPVKSRDAVVGTLAVGVRGLRKFNPDEIHMLSAIGDEVGVAIENNRLFQEQVFLAEQVLDQEHNYRELFEKAHDAIWVHDLTGNVIAANVASAQMLGFRKEEILKMNVKAFMGEQSLELAREVESKMSRGEEVEQPYEQKIITRDGSEAYLMISTSPLMRDGEIFAYQHIARNVTEQRIMTENLRFYVQQITRAQEEERKRIARELHDDTAQQLIVISRQIDKLLSLDPLPMADMNPLEKLAERVELILDGVRRYSQDLRPSILDDLGLLPALDWLASDMTDNFKINVKVDITGDERRLPPETELLLFRIVQESLSNVRKHSEAKNAKVSLKFDPHAMLVTIRDDGKGFYPPERLDDLTGMAKLGLAGMAERARLLGGSLRIISEPGDGTVVIVESPV